MNMQYWSRIGCLTLVCVVVCIGTVSAAAGTAVTRELSPATAAPGEMVTITLDPAPGTVTSPGWGVIETLPARTTVISGSSDADGMTELDTGQYRFTRLGGDTPISYRIRAPDAAGTYPITGEYTDGDLATGEVGGDVSLVVGGGGAASGTVTASPTAKAPRTPTSPGFGAAVALIGCAAGGLLLAGRQ